jgi:hypothetical protein
MIRAETDDTWILVTHPEHARVAGEIADAWGNEQFARPEPFAHVRYAVYHHDDGWIARDAAPVLTRTGKPEAFTRELVGTYAAFEEIDVPNYLQVRGEATEAVAASDAYAGVLVSMHTVNLLTEQADVASVRPEHRSVFDAFVAEQRQWQQHTAQKLGADAAALQRGFEFLQCCDNLSLIACSGYDSPRALRHLHPDRNGVRHTLHCTPGGVAAWTIAPWPFRTVALELTLERRRVAKSACGSLERFREAFAAARLERMVITLRAG